jgi:hypothetical protein
VTSSSDPPGIPKALIPAETAPAGAGHLVRVTGGLLLLVLIGVLVLRWLLPDATLAEGLGLAPVVAIGLVTITGFVVLAVIRSPFSAGPVWFSYVVALGVSILALVRARTRASLREAKPSAVA